MVSATRVPCERRMGDGQPSRSVDAPDIRKNAVQPPLHTHHASSASTQEIVELKVASEQQR